MKQEQINGSDKKQKFIDLLGELFQLNQPELDFGLYRIMHAKSEQIRAFIREDLTRDIDEALADGSNDRIAELQAAYENELNNAKKYGAPNPELVDAVREAKAAYDAARDNGDDPSEIYDHLYRFFTRYYDKGDFLSRRYHVAENDTRAAPYAVPYDGREVYLHWANKDQYYIKSTETLSNFSFDLGAALAKEAKRQGKAGLDLEVPEGKALKVSMRLVDAAEGAHNNVKENQSRFFFLHAENPVELLPTDSATAGAGDGSELLINFEYRPDPEKTGQEGAWQKKRLEEAEANVLAALMGLPEAKPFLDGLASPAPTEKQKKRTLLGKYLAQYTARNTMDYFIHKDLGGFLRRELDFYIKNEVMRLDDVDETNVEGVTRSLKKIAALRKIGRQIIAFLAQLEDFQKKLWLKKKFVTETNYCITLDRIPENFYPEIAANDRQRDEWRRLFAIDELGGYTVPLSSDFLAANPHLIVDTSNFDKNFQERLLAEDPQLDATLDGVLLFAENYQAIRLIERRYAGAIDSMYADPPYNKRKDHDFAYKDSFQHSSWISMMRDRVAEVSGLLKKDACLFFSIDENEFNNLYFVGRNVLGFQGAKVLPAITNLKGNQDTEGFASCHEYILAFAKRSLSDVGRLPIDEETLMEGWLEDELGLYKEADGLRATGVNAPRNKRPNLWYPIFFLPDGTDFYVTEDDRPLVDDHIAVWPVNESGDELSWYWKKAKVSAEKHNLIVKRSRTGQFTLYKKQRPGIGDIPTRKPKSFLYLPEYSSTHGGNMAQDVFGRRMSSFTPKSVRLVEDLVRLGVKGSNGVLLDIFAGSGTSGHAVINLNRGDGGARKYVLVEMGEHFDAALLPRIKKAIYSSDWRDGKPVSRAGSSHCFKWLRLESYEDSLNNLVLDGDAQRERELAKGAIRELRRDYLLHYFLDVETRGSASLLNVTEFRDPTAYQLMVKRPGGDEQAPVDVDLVETFNWLIGLEVDLLDRPRAYRAEFEREADPELPGDQHTRVVVKGNLKETDAGPYWFRLVEGTVRRTPENDADRDKVLVVWRKLTDDPEKDAAALEALLAKYKINQADSEFDAIYINGPHGLSLAGTAKARLLSLEEAFMARMWADTDSGLAN